ncbi:hypothetical protein LCGC14_1445330 [marine sediment metagenome]|uniref:Uncharacterized protein n=1 Tax=marine sediment metagenome TaxID=412755 RepID=A0A0F9JK40_9ZZZZ
MITILLVAILAVQIVTFVVVYVGTNFTSRAWRLPLIGKPLQAVVQKVLRKSSN